MCFSWLHLSCSFLVEDTSEVVLKLSFYFPLMQYTVLERESLSLTGKGRGQVSDYYEEGCGRSGDKSKYQIPILILPWAFYIQHSLEYG